MVVCVLSLLHEPGNKTINPSTSRTSESIVTSSTASSRSKQERFFYETSNYHDTTQVTIMILHK